MSDPYIVELEAVNVASEDASAVVVRDVSWQIAPGDFWVIGGAPDCGKTSLLATAAALRAPAGGTLRVLGRALLEAPERDQIAWRRSIGFVFERGGRLLHHLTVAENIALPLEYHLDQDADATAARVQSLLARAELSDLAQAMPSRLSQRHQQRAGLMRALAVPAQALFLDDPLNGLAPREVRWWSELLAELRAEQAAAGTPLTVVASCGEFRDWLELATHFGVIAENRFRVLGGRDQLLASDAPVVRELIS